MPVFENNIIPGERWGGCETFTTDNRGRNINVTLIRKDFGERLAEEISIPY